MTKIKICGLTNKDDATWALNFGADYLGFNFFKESPRHASLSSVKKWIHQLPSFALRVGVFVNASNEEILKTVNALNLRGVQCHGDESLEQLGALRMLFEAEEKKVFLIKTLRVQSEESLASLSHFQEVVDTFLLDAYVPDQRGGTGATFNWDLAIKAKENSKPFFLAGGLTPENVGEAIKKVQPFGVDVASGVEKGVRKKDHNKMQQFIQNAKSQKTNISLA